MANNPVIVTKDGEKFWFEMHVDNDMKHSVKVYSGKGVENRKTSLYYIKLGSEEKHAFSDLKDCQDCKRFMSLCDIYLSKGDATKMEAILTKCENKNITDLIAKKLSRLTQDALDTKGKAKHDREFIIETVDSMNIADILIKKFAPLTDIDEDKAKNLRSMYAAMRAIRLVKESVSLSEIFTDEQITEAGTTKKVFEKTLKADLQ